MKTRMHFACLMLAYLSITTVSMSSEAEWVTIKAENLSEWSDPGQWWKADQGVIIAESNGGPTLPKVHYLVWNGSIKGDFELRLEYRIIATAPRDAGVNVRVERPFPNALNLPSYQAELDLAHLYGATNNNRFGKIHDGKRGRMFDRNRRVTIQSDGTESVAPLEVPFETTKVFRDPPQWNECLIRLQGDHVQLYLNGVLATEIVDGDLKKRPAGDGIALQYRPVDASRFEVKNLQYRVLMKL